MLYRGLSLALLASVAVVHGCTGLDPAALDPRLRSTEIEPLEIGYGAPRDGIAARIAAEVDGLPASDVDARADTWSASYRGGGRVTAALQYLRFYLRAEVRVGQDRVEIVVVESKNLSHSDGRIHKLATAHLKSLRWTVESVLREERLAWELDPQARDHASPLPQPGDLQGPGGRASREPSVEGMDFGGYHAIVIGNDRYAELPLLRTAVADAVAVGRVLEEEYGFEVELLRDAKRTRIVSALNSYRTRLAAGDNLLIYYAGHGWFDEEAQRGYWLPVDAAREDPANWISNATITDLIRAMPAKHVMVVADSCYSGTLTRGLKVKLGDVPLEKLAAKRTRTALTSGGLEPVEDGTGRHSVFAAAFIQALRANEHVMDGHGLFATMRRPVMLEADRTPEYGDIRRAGHEGGDFLFVRTGRR